MRSQGAEESDLTVMPAKFIAQIDLVDSKQLNVTEQSVMLSCYASRDSVAKFLRIFGKTDLSKSLPILRIMLCYVIDNAFPSPVSSDLRRTKVGRSTPKIRSPKVNLTNFLIKLLIRLGRKYYFNFTCQKRGLFVRSRVVIYWGLKIGPKLLSFLVTGFLYC